MAEGPLQGGHLHRDSNEAAPPGAASYVSPGTATRPGVLAPGMTAAGWPSRDPRPFSPFAWTCFPSWQHADSGVGSDSARQAFVGRQELGSQDLGKRDVAGIVGAEVRAKAEHTPQQRLVPMPRKRQEQVVVESELRSLRRDERTEQGSSEPGRDLDVTQRRHPEIHIGLAQDIADRRRPVGLQQILEQRRSVGDDRSQRCARSARSSWISSAAGRPS